MGLALGSAPCGQHPHTSRCSVSRGFLSFFQGGKGNPEAAPGFVTGYWSLFTRPRGGPASPVACFLSACQFLSREGQRGTADRISFPRARRFLRPQLLHRPLPRAARLSSHVYLGQNSARTGRTGRCPLFIFKANPFPSRRAGRPGCGVSGRQWRGARASMRFQAFVAGASCRWVNGAEEIGEGRQKWSLKEGVSTGQRDKGQNTHGRRGTDGDGRGKTIRPRARGRGAAPSFSS